MNFPLPHLKLIGIHWFLSSFLVDFPNAQFTPPPQNISGTFGLQLNSYPQSSSQSQSSSLYANPYTQQSATNQQNYYGRQYSTQFDHYGYPSPEQLAQIPSPPLEQRQTSAYPYSLADLRGQQQPADWRSQQQTAAGSSADQWRQQQQQQAQQQQYLYGATTPLNPAQSISNNNNIPYAQQQQQQQYAQEYANKMALYGRQYDPYGQQQQQQYGQPQRGNDYLGQQGGGSIGTQQQQLLPREQQQGQRQQFPYNAQNRPLNAQYQSPSSRIVFPNNQQNQQDAQGRQNFWFNSALHVQQTNKHLLGLNVAFWLIIMAILY